MKFLWSSFLLFNKILFFILNILLVYLFYVKFLLIIEYDYNKDFYNNKERTLLIDIKKNNCKRPLDLLFLYNEEISDNVKNKIIEKCRDTVYYNSYIFNKSLFKKDIEQLLMSYEEILRSNNIEEINHSVNMIKVIYPYLSIKEKEILNKKINW